MMFARLWAFFDRPRTVATLPGQFRYRAFLSYRSSDKKIAEKLHRKLETYRVPAGIVGKNGSRGPIPAQLGRLFRDRDELRSAEDVETIIAGELARSIDLVVLCTPAAADPKAWVGREIEIFRERRSDGQVHAIIGYGDPPSCFPLQLLKQTPAGRIEQPLAADMRREGDGMERASIKVVAGLLGIEFDDLWQRERRRKRVRLLSFSLSLFAATVVLGLSLKVWSELHAVNQYLALSTAAQEKQKWDLAALSAAAAVQSQKRAIPFSNSTPINRLKSLRLWGRTSALIRGYTRAPIGGVIGADRVYTSNLDGNIASWHLGEKLTNDTELVNIFRFVGPARSLELSADGKLLLALSEAGQAALINVQSGKVNFYNPQTSDTIRFAKFVTNGTEALFVKKSGDLLASSTVDFALQKSMAQVFGDVAAFAVSSDGEQFAIANTEGVVWMGDTRLKSVERIAQKGELGGTAHLSFDKRGKILVATNGQIARVYDATTKDLKEWFSWHDLSLGQTEISTSGQTALSLASGDSVLIWSTATGDFKSQLIVSGCSANEAFKPSCRASTVTPLPNNNGKNPGFVVGYWDGTLRLWNEHGEQMGELRGHVSRITSISTSADGKRLLSTSEDRSSRIWALGSVENSDDLLRVYCEETANALTQFNSPEIFGDQLRISQMIDIDIADDKPLIQLTREVQHASPCK